MRGWVENGSADGYYGQSKSWTTEDKYLQDLKVRVEEALKSSGAFMQSESGEAMQNQAMPVVLWTEVTAENAKAQSQLMTDQGEAFAKVQSSIPGKGEEQEAPDSNWFKDTWDSMVNGQTDAEAAKEHNEKLRQEAVQAFQTYQSTSQSTVAASSRFDPPPASGMNVATSSSPHTNVGGVPQVSGSPSGTSSQWAGGGGTGGTGGGGYSSTSPSGYTGGPGGSGGPGSVPGGTSPVWRVPGPGGGPGQNGPGQTGPGGGRVPGPGVGGPGMFGPGGPGGSGSGSGSGSGGRGVGAGGAGGSGRGGVGAGGSSGRGAGSGPGAGGRAGIGGPGGSGTGSGSGSGSGAAGGRGGVGGAGGAAAGRGQGKPGEEDQEHETPEYLKGDHGFFDDDMPKVAPPVFGDWNQQQ
ncbi:hypothetical protein OU415_32655 [Saccharopolyspora sp. WRP15-2]|uniref:PPE family protein n=1 Tax=Saccharopolyspora oryzae TaxID=2997343 RepID=A0ABT4V9W8_9PSEU|nr:hypothetical protein [Saccharopolyspora oryzae]MDA3630219.1 hypothetical protein [Saccharopolyspora oryzae]